MSDQTRPDIAYDVCQLATKFKYSDDKNIKYDISNKNLFKLRTKTWEMNVI